MWFEITVGCLCDFEHVTSGIIVLTYSILAYYARYDLCKHISVQCTHIYYTFTWKHTHTFKAHTSVLALMPTHTCSTVDLSCVMETGVRYCVMCVGVISLGKRTKDLTGAARGPTITAWNITAVKEPSLWQEESWAPVSDSADQNLFCGHKDGRDR